MAAASREQAEILYRQAEGFVLRSERLYAPVHSAIQAAKGKRKTDVPRFTCLEGYRRINHHGGGRIQIFAADDRTGDGIIPTLGIIDEPHRLPDLRLYRVWSGKLRKRNGQLAAISTAGEPGSDFEQTRTRIRETATDKHRDGSFLRAATEQIVMHDWAVPEAEDPTDMEAVKRANPFSGITVESLTAKFESPTMTNHHWMRFVCNRPTHDANVWLGPDAAKIWSSIAAPFEFVDGAPTWVGIDAAITKDTTAVVWIQRDADGDYHARAKVWAPGIDQPVDLTDVMQFVRELDARYQLEAVSYDKRFFDVPAKMLEDEGIPVIEVPQTVEHMTPAIGGLYELIKQGKMHHDGDETLTMHVLNAVPRYNERGFTLQKAKSRGKIDACIALALAVERALRTETSSGSLFAWA